MIRYRVIAAVCGLIALGAYLVDAAISDEFMSHGEQVLSDVLGVVIAVSLLLGIALAAVAQVRAWRTRH